MDGNEETSGEAGAEGPRGLSLVMLVLLPVFILPLRMCILLACHIPHYLTIHYIFQDIRICISNYCRMGMRPTNPWIHRAKP